jgi:hypothetical protein
VLLDSGTTGFDIRTAVQYVNMDSTICMQSRSPTTQMIPVSGWKSLNVRKTVFLCTIERSSETLTVKTRGAE